MIKSFEEADAIYRKRYSKKRSLKEQFEEACIKYENANPFTKIFLKKPTEAILKDREELEFPAIGQKYAITYEDIVGPIVSANYDENGYIISGPGSYGREFFDPTDLEIGDIYSLWTVVEYTGNGQFVDLVTGKIFGLPVEATSVLNTVCQDTEAKAEEIKQELLANPLRIKSSKVFSYVRGEGFGPDSIVYYKPISSLLPVLQELSDDVKVSIMEETMPKKAEIIKELANLETQSRENVEDYYAYINKRQMDEFYDDAMQISEAMHEEEEMACLRQLEAIEKMNYRIEAERLRMLRDKLVSEFEETFGDEENKEIKTHVIKK